MSKLAIYTETLVAAFEYETMSNVQADYSNVTTLKWTLSWLWVRLRLIYLFLTLFRSTFRIVTVRYGGDSICRHFDGKAT